MFLLLFYISSRIFHRESLCNKNKLSVAGLALCTSPTFFCRAVSSLSSCALPSPSPNLKVGAGGVRGGKERGGEEEEEDGGEAEWEKRMRQSRMSEKASRSL